MVPHEFPRNPGKSWTIYRRLGGPISHLIAAEDSHFRFHFRATAALNFAHNFGNPQLRLDKKGAISEAQ